MNGILSRLVVVNGLGLFLILSVSCAGDPERAAGPISPSAAAVDRQLAAPNQVSQAGLQSAGLESAELDEAGIDATEGGLAAAVSLSGTWPGTIKSTVAGNGPPPLKITVKFTHTGTRLTGTFKLPPDDGVIAVVTFDVKQTKTVGAKRTFTGTLKTVFKGDPCSPSTMPGSLVVDTGKKPMTLTGTFKGKSPGCWIETEVFSLKKG